MKNEEVSFEAAMEQLESIAQQLEDGDLGIGEALEAYEKGIRFLKQCHTILREAERKISILTGIDEDGAAVVERFDDAAGSFEEKQDSRAERRSERQKAAPKPDSGADMDIQQGLF